jgi:MFS family permease
VVATVIASRNLLPGSDPDTHLDEEEVLSFADPGSVGQRFRVASLTPITLMLGLFTLLAVTVEEIPPRWSSIYLGSIGVDEQFVGVAFVAFTLAMMAGRFTGDRLVDRFGEIRVVRASMITATIALLLGLFSSSFIGFTLACMVTGYGIATLFPAAMRAAAHIPGIRPASAVTVVSWLARLGFIIAPLIVGFVAETAGPGGGVACAAVAAAVIVPMAVVLRWGLTPSPRAVSSSG